MQLEATARGAWPPKTLLPPDCKLPVILHDCASSKTGWHVPWQIAGSDDKAFAWADARGAVIKHKAARKYVRKTRKGKQKKFPEKVERFEKTKKKKKRQKKKKTK